MGDIKLEPSELSSKAEQDENPKEITIPYSDVCRRRYARMKFKYNEQFRRELQELERQQPTAHEAMRFHRHFVITTLWPPLHTRQEIEWTIRYFQDPFTPKERRRLENLLSERKYSWLEN